MRAAAWRRTSVMKVGLDGDGLREAVGEGGGEGGLGGDGGVEEVELGGLEDKVEVGEDGVGEAQDGVGEVAGDGRIVSLSRISTVLGTVEVQPKTRFWGGDPETASCGL